MNELNFLKVFQVGWVSQSIPFPPNTLSHGRYPGSKQTVGFNQNREEREEMREGQGHQTSAQGRDDKCPQDGRWEERNEDEKGRKTSENQCVFKSQWEKKKHCWHKGTSGSEKEKRGSLNVGYLTLEVWSHIYRKCQDQRYKDECEGWKEAVGQNHRRRESQRIESPGYWRNNLHGYWNHDKLCQEQCLRASTMLGGRKTHKVLKTYLV